MENEGRNLFCNRWELDDQEFFKDNSVVEGAVLLKNQSVLYHFR
ncbi:hypothetical protein STZ1_30006 [Bacillus subtilis]